MTLCYIGIGSNLKEPLTQVAAAVEALAQLPDSQLVASSPRYASRPIGPQDQPDFINSVAALETTLPPLALLDQLQSLEQRAGRVRLRHWGERSLDLDLLLYGDQTIEQPRLTVPHPEMRQRAFVLLPLHDLAPSLLLPTGEPVESLLDGVADQQITLLD